MKHADVIELNGSQAVRLPDEFRFNSDSVTIRREGKAVVLEPAPSTEWPEGFFDAIHIDDPAFKRPSRNAKRTTPIEEGPRESSANDCNHISPKTAAYHSSGNRPK